MIQDISLKCPECQHPFIVRSGKILYLHQRIALLEALLRHHEIKYYDPSAPETYGKYIDYFLSTSIIDVEAEEIKEVPSQNESENDTEDKGNE